MCTTLESISTSVVLEKANIENRAKLVKKEQWLSHSSHSRLPGVKSLLKSSAGVAYQFSGGQTGGDDSRDRCH